MKKYILILLLPLLTLNVVRATNNPEADKIVKRVIANLKKTSYKCTFSVVYYNEADKSSQNKTGVLQIDNRLFRLVMQEIETKYDGKTQWVYSSENNEVTITEPTQDELKDLNPMVMIDYYVKTHRISLDDKQEKNYDPSKS